MGYIRIIAGQWRGRKILVSKASGLRPTSDRMRETLFNWLGQDLTAKSCLDLYTGSGILALEALSRGADFVDCVDISAPITAQLKQQAQTLNAQKIAVHTCDALAFLSQIKRCYDIIFIDPPFHGKQAEIALKTIVTCLHEKTMVYLETEKGFKPSDEWTILREKQTQQSHCRLMVFNG